jgi:hypothetical protein
LSRAPNRYGAALHQCFSIRDSSRSIDSVKTMVLNLSFKISVNIIDDVEPFQYLTLQEFFPYNLTKPGASPDPPDYLICILGSFAM